MTEHLSTEQEAPKEEHGNNLYAKGNHLMLIGVDGHNDYSWEVIDQSEDGEVIYARQEGGSSEQAFLRADLDKIREEFDRKFEISKGHVAVKSTVELK